MIFSYCLMLLLFSIFVNTQSLSDKINSLPSCSDSCLDAATGSLGCSVEDFSCFCADESGSPTQGSTVSSATSCIQNSCSLLDASTTLKVVGQICVLINDPTSSISISSSTTSRASGSFTTSLKSRKTSSNSILSSSMASTSVTVRSSTSTSSHRSSGKGLSNVVIGMIVLAVVATLLILAVIARLLWKRRASRKNSSTGGRFQNLDEEDGVGKETAELQGDDTQIFKWGGIGVRKSVRVHTQRITSYISPVSPKHRSRNESWGEARDHLATIDENLRGVGQSPEPIGRIDTSPVRWPSTSTANSPTTPEMTEPMGALFPPHHYRINLSRESLPPSLPALDLPSITLSSTSRPNTPHLPLPKSPPPGEVPVKTVARLSGPFSDFPHQMPPSPQTAGIPYGTLARSLSVSDNYSYPRAFPTPFRHSIASIPNTPTTTNFASPISPPLPSPSAQSFHTFGARSSTYSQASISTFQTFPTSPEDPTDIPPLPTIPTIYPMSTYTLSTHGSRRRASASASEVSRSQTKRYHHSKQTSLSKIKPKMIYISNMPGMSIVSSDSIFGGLPEHDLGETAASNNPFLTNTNTDTDTDKDADKDADTNTNPNPTPPIPLHTKNPTKPTVSVTIRPLIDRFDTISSNSSFNSSTYSSVNSNSNPRFHPSSQRSSEKLKFQPRIEEKERECFSEEKEGKSGRRREGLLRGSGRETRRGSVDLGVKGTSWFDASV